MPPNVTAVTSTAQTAVQKLLAVAGPPPMDYTVPAQVADAPLVSADVAALATATKALLTADNIVLPEADDLVERCVVGLLGGHLVLHGPPGTGKTYLARALGKVFDVGLSVVTGTPEWTTYDVIGGLRPSIGPSGDEVLRPWLGAVSQAAVRCVATVAAHLDTNAGQQAYWLLIDELSRADIDRAIGPLYTALAAGKSDERRVQLWFVAEEGVDLILPERFRILGTMNDVDTAYVNQLSQGLQRRFQFVFVGVPHEAQGNDEATAALTQAARWYGSTYSGLSGSALDEHVNITLGRAEVEAARVRLRDLVRFLRWEAPRWPVGTAQVMDVFRQVMIRAADPEADLTASLDAAVADRLLPQAAGLVDDRSLDAIFEWLADRGMERGVLAIRHVRAPQST